MKYYYKTPTHCVALNPKVGSSSLARAIIRAYYPKREHLIRTAAFPAGKDASKRLWHWMCPGTTTPDKPVVVLVRDPVDRFRSACQQVGVAQEDVDSAIDSLVKDKKFQKADKKAQAGREARQARRAARQEKGKGKKRRPGYLRDDAHFAPQAECCCGDTVCFQFPRDINAAAELLGLGAIPQENKAKREKVTLTEEQKKAVREYYAADQALFDSITQAGWVRKGPKAG